MCSRDSSKIFKGQVLEQVMILVTPCFMIGCLGFTEGATELTAKLFLKLVVFSVHLTHETQHARRGSLRAPVTIQEVSTISFSDNLQAFLPHHSINPSVGPNVSRCLPEIAEGSSRCWFWCRKWSWLHRASPLSSEYIWNFCFSHKLTWPFKGPLQPGPDNPAKRRTCGAQKCPKKSRFFGNFGGSFFPTILWPENWSLCFEVCSRDSSRIFQVLVLVQKVIWAHSALPIWMAWIFWTIDKVTRWDVLNMPEITWPFKGPLQPMLVHARSRQSGATPDVWCSKMFFTLFAPPFCDLKVGHCVSRCVPGIAQGSSRCWFWCKKWFWLHRALPMHGMVLLNDRCCSEYTWNFCFHTNLLGSSRGCCNQCSSTPGPDNPARRRTCGAQECPKKSRFFGQFWWLFFSPPFCDLKVGHCVSRCVSEIAQRSSRCWYSCKKWFGHTVIYLWMPWVLWTIDIVKRWDVLNIYSWSF